MEGARYDIDCDTRAATVWRCGEAETANMARCNGVHKALERREMKCEASPTDGMLRQQPPWRRRDSRKELLSPAGRHDAGTRMVEVVGRSRQRFRCVIGGQVACELNFLGVRETLSHVHVKCFKSPFQQTRRRQASLT
jgi:hypothetical protein